MSLSINVYYLRFRPARHTGEHVLVEPLPKFLRRCVWVPRYDVPDAPTPRTPTLADYDREGFEEEEVCT